MRSLLTDKIVKEASLPATGNKIIYDDGDKAVKGFGLRVTAAGSRAFILNYRTRSGLERRYTIGKYPDWKVGPARSEAMLLKQRIDRGEDPLADIKAEREAPTMADLCGKFMREHSERKNRALTTKNYKGAIDRWILPELKNRKVAEIGFADVENLHAKVTRESGPYAANRIAALLSKMFSLAIKWQYRTDNPAKGIERNQELKRHRYLSSDEMTALLVALNAHADKQAANIVRLLLLTGARRGEAFSASWDQFDLTAGVWTKPGATTKQKTDHRVPLSAPARQLLSEILAGEQAKAAGNELSPWVFPGRLASGGPREGIRRAWDEMCETAGFKTRVRIHDLRHTYASILASSGLSLHIIGQLLGHTQAATTHRYSHLFDDPLRAATERVGAIVGVKREATGQIIPLKGTA